MNDKATEILKFLKVSSPSKIGDALKKLFKIYGF